MALDIKGALKPGIDVKELEEFLKMMVSKEAYDENMGTSEHMHIPELKAAYAHAVNVSEHMLKVLREENAQETISAFALSMILYNVTYGTLASTPDAIGLSRVSVSLEHVRQRLPFLMIRKTLGDLFK